MFRHFNLLKLLFSVFILGCSSNSNKENVVLSEMVESLEVSNNNLDKSSQTFLYTLEGKIYEPSTSEKAKFWKSKADEVYKLSQKIYSYVKQIKDELKETSNTNDKNGDGSFDGRNKSAVNKILFADKKGEELITQLKNYREIFIQLILIFD